MSRLESSNSQGFSITEIDATECKLPGGGFVQMQNGAASVVLAEYALSGHTRFRLVMSKVTP